MLLHPVLNRWKATTTTPLAYLPLLPPPQGTVDEMGFCDFN